MSKNSSLDDALADSPLIAARRLGVSRSQFYLELRAGRIRARKLGRRTLVPRAEQARWLSELPLAAPAEIIEPS